MSDQSINFNTLHYTRASQKSSPPTTFNDIFTWAESSDVAIAVFLTVGAFQLTAQTSKWSVMVDIIKQVGLSVWEMPMKYSLEVRTKITGYT